jgi:hypothetical protein
VANREQKSNREKKKPKAEKPKMPPQTTFAHPTFVGTTKSKSGGKKNA